MSHQAADWPLAGLGHLAFPCTHFKNDSVQESTWLPGKRLVRGHAQTPWPPLALAPGESPGRPEELATTGGCPRRDDPSKEDERMSPGTEGTGGSSSRGSSLAEGQRHAVPTVRCVRTARLGVRLHLLNRGERSRSLRSFVY